MTYQRFPHCPARVESTHNLPFLLEVKGQEERRWERKEHKKKSVGFHLLMYVKNILHALTFHFLNIFNLVAGQLINKVL